MSSISSALDKLNREIDIAPSILSEKQNHDTSKWDFARKIAIRNYLCAIQGNRPKIEASENIASILFPNRNVSHSGRLIRTWAQLFLDNGQLPMQNQEKFVKMKSLIHDEDVQRILRAFIRMENDISLTSTKMSAWINENLHMKLGLERPLAVSPITGQ